MHNVRKMTEDLYWVGVNDKKLPCFEGLYPAEGGVSYNAYVLLDDKTVLFDTVDWSVARQFIENVEFVLNGRPLDYLVVNHVEPDHAAAVNEVLLRHPETQIISTKKALMFMRQYGINPEDRCIEVREGDIFGFGSHEVTFVAAPMVHWPEAMMTYDITARTLFSADAFGSFKSLDGALFADEVNFKEEWAGEARRYYTNIVGKYGTQVMNVLKKVSSVAIDMICPLHGPVWREDLGWIINKYIHWATYEPEETGVLIVYGSIYGNTEQAAQILASRLVEKGMTNVRVYDAAETHYSYLIAEAFRYSHLAVLSVTHNLNVFPPMQALLDDMKRLNLQNRTVAVVENGTWAPTAGKGMIKTLESMKQMTVLNGPVSVLSSVSDANNGELDALAEAIIQSMEPVREG
jgi:flavorubredoxin